jgi:UDP-N-acetylmuramyl pentapeptide phosphotransferase/UDP-N-acetylglucosamine-1-phosphate transferase
MDFFLYYSVLVGLMATWIATRKWILKAPEIGLVGRDMNKLEKPQVPEMGGVSIGIVGLQTPSACWQATTAWWWGLGL